MPVQANLRTTTTTAASDTAPPAPGDATGLADLFNALVAGVAGSTVQAPAADTTTETPPATAPKQKSKPGNDVAASVEQLLAVANGKPAPTAPQGKTKGGTKKQEQEPDAASTPLLPSLQPAAPVPSPAAQLQASVTAAFSPAPAKGPATIKRTTTAAVSTAVNPAGGKAVPDQPTTTLALKATPLVMDAAFPPAMPMPAKSPPQPAATPQKSAAPADTALPVGIDIPAAAPSGDAPQTPAAPQKAAAPAQVPTSPVQAAVTTLLANIREATTQRSSQTERTRSASSPVAAIVAALKPVDQPALPSTAAPPPALAAQATDGTAASQPLQGLVIERQLDLAHQQDWIDQLARDISNAAGGEGKILRFHLNPEHLGTLQVEISQSHHGAAVRISADNAAARTIIADAQPRLLAEARAQGVRISEAHVDLGSNGSSDPRRPPAALPDEAQVRTARSLQEETGDDGKPTPNRRDLYA